MTPKCQTESPPDQLNLARLHSGRHKDCRAARADAETGPSPVWFVDQPRQPAAMKLRQLVVAAIAGRDCPQARMKRRR